MLEEYHARRAERPDDWGDEMEAVARGQPWSVVAANIASTRVYDREAFEATAGDDLPWTTDEALTGRG
jgi:hypothetical protein